jgi:hypothetical protein
MITVVFGHEACVRSLRYCGVNTAESVVHRFYVWNFNPVGTYAVQRYIPRCARFCICRAVHGGAWCVAGGLGVVDERVERVL